MFLHRVSDCGSRLPNNFLMFIFTRKTKGKKCVNRTWKMESSRKIHCSFVGLCVRDPCVCAFATAKFLISQTPNQLKCYVDRNGAYICYEWCIHIIHNAVCCFFNSGNNFRLIPSVFILCVCLSIKGEISRKNNKSKFIGTYHFREVPFKIGFDCNARNFEIFSPFDFRFVFFFARIGTIDFVAVHMKSHIRKCVCVIGFHGISEMRINSCEIIVPFIFNFVNDWYYICAIIDACTKFIWHKHWSGGWPIIGMERSENKISTFQRKLILEPILRMLKGNTCNNNYLLTHNLQVNGTFEAERSISEC